MFFPCFMSDSVLDFDADVAKIQLNSSLTPGSQNRAGATSNLNWQRSVNGDRQRLTCGHAETHML